MSPRLENKMNTRMKVLLGIGGACAACCAVPVGAALMGAGGVAAAAAALWECRDEYVGFGVIVALVILGSVGWALWQRRQTARARSCHCGPTGCGNSKALPLEAIDARACLVR
jgi:hypothetical protein